ncbi:unnamed protein product [Thelazia callipaeda]|uniref:Serine/threonine-protein kinase Nek5 n=1 Tax=Thelazia callipaeda TaxID=103827 RepID=A0A0N5CQ58_THECL|nr:unnamed protein product [Thelazia callipaeda]
MDLVNECWTMDVEKRCDFQYIMKKLAILRIIYVSPELNHMTIAKLKNVKILSEKDAELQEARNENEKEMLSSKSTNSRSPVAASNENRTHLPSNVAFGPKVGSRARNELAERKRRERQAEVLSQNILGHIEEEMKKILRTKYSKSGSRRAFDQARKGTKEERKKSNRDIRTENTKSVFEEERASESENKTWEGNGLHSENIPRSSLMKVKKRQISKKRKGKSKCQTTELRPFQDSTKCYEMTYVKKPTKIPKTDNENQQQKQIYSKDSLEMESQKKKKLRSLRNLTKNRHEMLRAATVEQTSEKHICSVAVDDFQERQNSKQSSVKSPSEVAHNRQRIRKSRRNFSRGHKKNASSSTGSPKSQQANHKTSAKITFSSHETHIQEETQKNQQAPSKQYVQLAESSSQSQNVEKIPIQIRKAQSLQVQHKNLPQKRDPYVRLERSQDFTKKPHKKANSLREGRNLQVAFKRLKKVHNIEKVCSPKNFLIQTKKAREKVPGLRTAEEDSEIGVQKSAAKVTSFKMAKKDSQNQKKSTGKVQLKHIVQSPKKSKISLLNQFKISANKAKQSKEIGGSLQEELKKYAGKTQNSQRVKEIAQDRIEKSAKKSQISKKSTECSQYQPEKSLEKTKNALKIKSTQVQVQMEKPLELSKSSEEKLKTQQMQRTTVPEIMKSHKKDLNDKIPHFSEIDSCEETQMSNSLPSAQISTHKNADGLEGTQESLRT